VTLVAEKRDEEKAKDAPAPTPRLLDVPDSPRELARHFYELGLSDGLPIIPPTEQAVREMLELHALDATTSVGRLPPKAGVASLGLLATNAVMAGVDPVAFPLVIAAVQALIEPDFNLRGVQATTHPCSPLLIVSGPIRHALRFNMNGNALGDSNATSATVGRAIRFVLRNIGGAKPGVTDMTTQGSPARAGFVLAENEELSPLPAYHVSRGFVATQNVVTVFASEGPHNINDHASNSGGELIEVIARSMATMGTNDLGRPNGNPVLVLGPEHATVLGRDGFTREQIQDYLFEHARVRTSDMPPDMVRWMELRDDVDQSLWTALGVPIANRAADFHVLVAGGPGRHSCHVPSFGYSRPISRPIAFRNVITCDC
jgi:hypothetical protein